MHICTLVCIRLTFSFHISEMPHLCFNWVACEFTLLGHKVGKQYTDILFLLITFLMGNIILPP